MAFIQWVGLKPPLKAIGGNYVSFWGRIQCLSNAEGGDLESSDGVVAHKQYPRDHPEPLVNPCSGNRL